jgi:hypothetical protein
MHLLTEHDEDKQYILPAKIDKRAVQQGRVLRLHTTKLSWAPRPREPIFLLRDEFLYRWYEAEFRSREERAAAQDKSDRQRVWDFIQRKRLDGHKVTLTELATVYRSTFGLSRDVTARICAELLSAGHLVQADLPRNEWRGQRKTFLELGTPLSGEGA